MKLSNNEACLDEAKNSKSNKYLSVLSNTVAFKERNLSHNFVSSTNIYAIFIMIVTMIFNKSTTKYIVTKTVTRNVQTINVRKIY